MSLTPTWTYSNFNLYSSYAGYTNVVYSYDYTVTITSPEGIVSQHVGFVRLKLDEITNFVPFEQLTQQIVQGWTEQSIDTARIVSELREQIYAAGATVITNEPAPWTQT